VEVCHKTKLHKRLFVLGQMVLMFFNGQGLVSQNKSMTIMFPILWGSIAWPIGQTWYSANLIKFAFGDPPSTFVANST
jgi:hypothetical protein